MNALNGDKPIVAYFASFLAHGKSKYFSTYFCGSFEIQTSHHYEPHYHWKTNDNFQLCIDYKIEEKKLKMDENGDSKSNVNDNDDIFIDINLKDVKAWLYFMKNDTILGNTVTRQRKPIDIKQGKFELDFENNYYFIALANHVDPSSLNDEGYEMEVKRC